MTNAIFYDAAFSTKDMVLSAIKTEDSGLYSLCYFVKRSDKERYQVRCTNHGNGCPFVVNAVLKGSWWRVRSVILEHTCANLEMNRKQVRRNYNYKTHIALLKSNGGVYYPAKCSRGNVEAGQKTFAYYGGISPSYSSMSKILAAKHRTGMDHLLLDFALLPEVIASLQDQDALGTYALDLTTTNWSTSQPQEALCLLWPHE